MITKAIVLNKIDNTNKYLVRIPIFESFVNTTDMGNVANASLFEATYSYQPGNTDGIMPNDVVYVGFENNDYNNVVILGKLYLGSESKATSHQNVNSLVVNGSTSLNGKVKINGVDISVVNEHSQALDDLFDIVSSTSFGDWVIEPNSDNSVLNFYRNTSEGEVSFSLYDDGEGHIGISMGQSADDTENIEDKIVYGLDSYYNEDMTITVVDNSDPLDVQVVTKPAYEIFKGGIGNVKTDTLYPDKIRILTGQEYDSLAPDYDEHTLYFLTSLPSNS